MEQIKKNIQALTDDELLIQFSNFKDEYTPVAFSIIEEEIKNRNLKADSPLKEATDSIRPQIVHLDEKDFFHLDHSFNKIELELAVTVLRENNVLFYIDNPGSTNTLPIESEADKQYTLHIYNKNLELSHQLLDEHFEKIEGRYLLKNRSAADQLKVISFNQIKITELEAKETVEVEFSYDEKKFIAEKGAKIITTADTIEKEQDRVIFYYDVIEALIEKIEDASGNEYTKTELLAVLEIIQIAAEIDSFPPFMEEATSALINLFLT